MKTIVTTDVELETLVFKSMTKALKSANAESTEVLSRRKAARSLGINRETLNRLIEAGSIKTTADGRFIPQWSISEYLNLKQCQQKQFSLNPDK